MLKFVILVENSLMNNDLFVAHKNSNYDKLYLGSFHKYENKKEYPEAFKVLLKEFENTYILKSNTLKFKKSEK